MAFIEAATAAFKMAWPLIGSKGARCREQGTTIAAL